MHEIIKDKIRDQFDRTEKKERDISLAHLAFFLALSPPPRRPGQTSRRPAISRPLGLLEHLTPPGIGRGGGG